MNTRIRNSIPALLLALLSVVSLTATALPDDVNQPTKIKADSASRNDQKGITIYSGNVIIEQGSLEITADRVLIHDDSEGITRIVSIGTPATMSQLPEPGAERIHAEANTIEYFPKSERLHLKMQALLKQEGSEVRSNSIDYFLSTRQVRANGGADTSSRVEMVIPAKDLQAIGDKPKSDDNGDNP